MTSQSPNNAIMTAENDTLLTHSKLGDHVDLRIYGNEPVTGLMMTTRSVGDRPVNSRRLTPDRQRIAEILMKSEPLRSLLIAHKVISEWLHEADRNQQSQTRHETIRYLENHIQSKVHALPCKGRPGGWLTATRPTAEAPNIERTIDQALAAFGKMVGDRMIHVFGREK